MMDLKLPKWLEAEDVKKKFLKWCAKKQGQQVLDKGIQIGKSEARDIVCKGSDKSLREQMISEQSIGSDLIQRNKCQGIVAYDEDTGTLRLPFSKMDMNKTRLLFDRALLFISLVDKTPLDSLLANLSAHKAEIQVLTLTQHTANFKWQVLERLHEAYAQDEELYQDLALAQTEQPHEREWMKLICEQLQVQLEFQGYQEKNERILREIHVEEVEYTKLKNSNKKFNMKPLTEEFLARKGQLQMRKKALDEELNTTLQKKFNPLLQAWSLLLQKYYQYLLENMYKKEENDSVSHYKEQFQRVSDFTQTWQAEWSEKNAAPVTFESASEHIEKLRKALCTWIRSDQSMSKVQIVELDSDDSDDDTDNEKPKMAFQDLHNQLSKNKKEKEGVLVALEQARSRLHRSYQKVEQVGLALLLDFMYGKVFQAYLEDDADRIMKGLLSQERQSESSKQPIKSNAMPTQVEEANEVLEEELHEYDERENVNQLFKNQTVYEMLESHTNGIKIKPMKKEQKKEQKKKEQKKKPKESPKLVVPNAVEIRMRGYESKGKAEKGRDKRRGKENSAVHGTKPAKAKTYKEEKVVKKPIPQVDKMARQENKTQERQRSEERYVHIPARLKKDFLTEGEVQEKLYFIMGESPKQREDRLSEFPELHGSQGNNLGKVLDEYCDTASKERDAQLIYNNAVDRAKAAFKQCKVNSVDTINDILLQRKRILSYAIEDSKANVALLNLKAAQERSALKSNAFKEQLSIAHEKLKHAEQQYESFCAKTNLV